MNAETKAKWLESLRSGRYQRGSGLLRNGHRHCCLGVLLDVVEPNGWTRFDDGFMHVDSACYSRPGARFLGAQGLSTQEVDRLINMNDYQMMSFEGIADYIEEHL